MDLTVTTVDYGGLDDHTWLGSEHGFVRPAPSITLDSDLFTTTFDEGFVPSGVVLAKVTATGLYGPYDGGAATGLEDALGHLKVGVRIQAGAHVGAALFTHGVVIEDSLPADSGIDAAAKTALTHIQYR